MASHIAVHERPVWREYANFMIFYDLSNDGLNDRWEQLWVSQICENEFRICCIPFFSYGVSLGDHVSTRESSGKKYVVKSVVKKSGHKTFRLWFGDVVSYDKIRLKVEDYLLSKKLLFEWSSKNLLAIDISEEFNEGDFTFFAQSLTEHGVSYEKG